VTRLRKNDAKLILLTLRHGLNWTNFKAAFSGPQFSLIKSIQFTAYFYPQNNNLTVMNLAFFHNTGLYPRPVHVEFVIDKVALR
jgi:hypothetical protein